MNTKTDWVVAGGKMGELSHCTRCGDGLAMDMPQRDEVVTAAMNAFVKSHSSCQPGHQEPPTVTPREWLAGRDTGTSSLTIFAAITGLPSPHRSYSPPSDASDFGRCYRLLKLFPVWRELLNKTVALCPEWKPFVDNWDELTALYEEELPSGKAPRLYARMKELGKDV